MVGDTLKKASESSGGKLVEIKDFGDAGYYIIFKSTWYKCNVISDLIILSLCLIFENSYALLFCW